MTIELGLDSDVDRYWWSIWGHELSDLLMAQTDHAIAEADVVLFLLDAQQGLVPLDLEILEKLRKQNSFVLPVVNKIDGVSEATAISI